MNNQQQTPLQKLISDKERVLIQCKLKEQKLNDDFTYIHENAGSLLLAGLSSLLFQDKKSTNKNGKQPSTSPSTEQQSLVFGMSDYISIAKGLLPVAWEVIQPILMTWGLKKVQKWFFGHLFKKKR